jgi:NAD(P)-dependent dehydrogenase (short-subunit alcohol dehydrogenase family)
MKSFKDKVAAITGAASGIGRALAVDLASRGCHLALSDVNETGLEETRALAAASGVKVTTQKLDVANRDAVYAWAESVAREHGKVNLIFNNAGVALAARMEDIAPKDFEWIMGINFWGVVWGSQAFLPHLKASGDGHIINISSLFGLMSLPTQGAYNVSKFAVRGYTEALRQELDMDGGAVSATCVHPGGIATNIAMSARVDDKLAERMGVDKDKARKRFDKIIQGTKPASAAKQILRAVEGNQRRVLVGPDAKFLDGMVRVLGSWYQPLTTTVSKRTM